MPRENEQRSSIISRSSRNPSIHITVLMLAIGIGTILFAYAAFVSTIDATPHDETLVQQVIFVFRHGDRTPTETYPNDPYLDYKWEGGWGALTKAGMLRAYNVGKWIRDKYVSTLGNKYDKDLVLTQSSYADRCIMSAQALLAGLYPPAPEEMFVPGLAWQPIPVHSIPRNLDKSIVVKAPCPRLERALQEAYLNESTRPGTPSNEYYQQLSNYTGKKIKTITDIEFLYNTLDIEARNGLKLPEWTKDYYNEKMREIAARSLAIFTSNDLQKRLRGGPFLKTIMESMHAFTNGKEARRAYFYSVHDVTMVNLLRTMGFTNEYFKPEYSATLIFQLHGASNLAEDAELKLMYVNDTSTMVPYHMNIPKCGTPCLLRNLMKLWENVIPDEWDDECRLD